MGSLLPSAALDKDLNSQLSFVAKHAVGPVEGVFGPASVTWRVSREAAIFLGAGRALLLQLAHPFVSAAIAEHSTALADPIGRFHRTFSLVFSLVFGNLEQAFSAAHRFHERHASINGVLADDAGRFAKGSAYSALDDAARLWVYATLTETALLAYELVQPPLPASECERYYQESKLLAALYGLPPDALPPDWAAFTAYCQAMHNSDSLAVTPAARAMADHFLKRVSGLPVPSWVRALTAHLLPPRLQSEFHLAECDAERAIRIIRGLYRFLPDRLRYVGPYHEAMARLAGKPKPDLLIRWSNRFWLGQPVMPK
jgi:uncharacterized protein (DUF2236 family)